MSVNQSSVNCQLCGTPNQIGSKFCIGCGSELSKFEIAGSNMGSVQNSNVGNFDQPRPLLYFHWAFPQNANAKILNPLGNVVAEISRTLIPLGIEYSIIDSITKETMVLSWVDETHIDIIRNNIKLGFIEIRKVKETIELKDLNESIEIMTEKDGFMTKKTIYEGNDEDNTLGFLKPLNPEKIIGSLPKNNLYELRLSKFGVGMRKILVFALFVLIYFRSNPIR